MATQGRLQPFAEFAALCAQIERRGRLDSVDGKMLGKLLDAARTIESVHGVAAEMQLGAEGFDNTERARHYASVQQHLLVAANELLKAGAVLKSEADR